MVLRGKGVQYMKFISNNDITDPTLNLAMEEYVLKHMPNDDSYFLFYVNRPSIIIGKNQNTIEEVNQPYIDEHGIDVVRRISGGGAVYHDTGNLNFSFITDDDGNSFHNFKKFTKFEKIHKFSKKFTDQEKDQNYFEKFKFVKIHEFDKNEK